jgi:hypothetical protein
LRNLLILKILKIVLTVVLKKSKVEKHISHKLRLLDLFVIIKKEKLSQQSFIELLKIPITPNVNGIESLDLNHLNSNSLNVSKIPLKLFH